MDIRVGCSGWNYRSWANGAFYPPRLPASRWLEHYASVFDTVEINTTFYRLARRDAVRRWVEQTPDGFCFSVKASRYLTHMKRLTDMVRGVERLCEPLEPLAAAGKLGPMLWQLPPNFRRDDDRLAYALDRLPPGRHCFEFRDPSWFAGDVLALLRGHGAALAIGDRRGLDFQPHVFTAPWTFVRLHFGHRGHRGNYSRAELREWARRLAAWPVDEAWVYFNNDWEAFAPANARELRRLIDRARAAATSPRPAAPAG